MKQKVKLTNHNSSSCGEVISKCEFDRVIKRCLSAQHVGDTIFYYDYRDNLIAEVNFVDNHPQYKKFKLRNRFK